MTRVLDVYLHEILAGRLARDDSGELSFSYDTQYLDRDRPALSLSLPPSPNTYEGGAVRAFFSGLLPDGKTLYRLAKYLGISEKNSFALLEAVGGECAGAISFYPQGTEPPRSGDERREVLDEKKLREILELLKYRPLLAEHDGIRMSLAGAQDKIAVGTEDGKITLVRGSAPTTHILKPMIADFKDSVQNELFCMRLAKLLGIPVANVETGWLDDTPYLLVERYDRMKDETDGVRRLHQEDFCQAMGIPPEVKYEREGGPRMSGCRDIIRKYSARPAADQIDFLDRIMFNYMIGNADAHGKNFSLLYRVPKPELAPGYDLMSTAVYPRVSKKMAMKIGRKYDPERLFSSDWKRLVPDTGTARRNLEKRLGDMAGNCVEKAVELRDSLEKTGIESSVFEDIYSVIEKRATLVKELLKKGF